MTAEAETTDWRDGVGFEAQILGTGYGNDDWQRDAYLWSVTLTYGDRKYRTDYWMGKGNVDLAAPRGWSQREKARKEGTLRYNGLGPGKDAIETPRAPERDEVLQSLASDVSLGDQAFEDFCADIDADPDSRKAYATWEACRTAMFDLRRLFGADYRLFAETVWED